MNKKLKIVCILIVVSGFIALSVRYLSHTSIPVLQPRGSVGLKERNLFLFALALSAVIVIPVFTILFSFAWRYRESNTHAKYSPEFDHSAVYETIWWVIPSVLILILSVVTWNSSHTLDPYRPLGPTNQEITIQAVALDWKWLFIYPKQHIASVNYVNMPENVPVNFEVTSDSVMNSFWIPQLGGQIYAMPGMSTQLHLVANQLGSFYGSSANISGSGFAGMNFTAVSSSPEDFNGWIKNTHQTNSILTPAKYAALALPSANNKVVFYSMKQTNLFDSILSKYDGPGTAMNNMYMGGI